MFKLKNKMKVSKEKSWKDIKSLIIIASKKILSRIHHEKNSTISHYFQAFPKPSLLICSDGFGKSDTNIKAKKSKSVIRGGNVFIVIVSARRHSLKRNNSVAFLSWIQIVVIADRLIFFVKKLVQNYVLQSWIYMNKKESY